ncbi:MULTISPECIES: ANTAR domain-containing protein [unclassified Streptomyces]|uniref:ANTAR domain-containing protein n=1 Tax=unclassified Streptomyces TaxID=2593676 RepID=UPI002DD833DC|nr:MULTISPECIES: ANTAR domain-containing protein [unclassified Streptomyces]WSA90880.1 ANTAR domain-containing protein [Streptomyces sp. NBC_01795]WSB75202.1 ANTAR domain-containing protein [Streptomyces sp. NBC_01775]WSS16514.1 ANTAR domain-containing protein [Streptomyces sp. NBC_01186]WSS45331.1 ANTAR domain-containing protein [Streptomyces sp. NBC_01187]
MDAHARCEEVLRLRREVEQLHRAMETRPVIDQARGVLMASWHCSADIAWNILVDTSQQTNTKLHIVAATVADSAHAQPMPPWLRSALLASRGRVTGATGKATDAASGSG